MGYIRIITHLLAIDPNFRDIHPDTPEKHLTNGGPQKWWALEVW